MEHHELRLGSRHLGWELQASARGFGESFGPAPAFREQRLTVCLGGAGSHCRTLFWSEDAPHYLGFVTRHVLDIYSNAIGRRTIDQCCSGQVTRVGEAEISGAHDGVREAGFAVLALDILHIL